MTSLVAAGYFTNVSRTNAEAKSAQDDLVEVVRELLGGAAETTLTIATGSITPILGIHAVDTEAAASADFLDNIVITNTPVGRTILIHAADAGRTVSVQHSQGGSGEIILVDAATFSMDDTDKWLWLQLRGTQWIEIGRFYGNDKAGLRTFLQLGTASLVNTGTADANVSTNLQLKATARAFTEPQRVLNEAVVASATGAQVLNLDTDVDHKLTLTGSISISNPTVTTAAIGQRGRIRLIQDATGGRVLSSMGTSWKRVGGDLLLPVLDTTANAVHRLDYEVISAARIEYGFAQVVA